MPAVSQCFVPHSNGRHMNHTKCCIATKDSMVLWLPPVSLLELLCDVHTTTAQFSVGHGRQRKADIESPECIFSRL